MLAEYVSEGPRAVLVMVLCFVAIIAVLNDPTDLEGISIAGVFAAASFAV